MGVSVTQISVAQEIRAFIEELKDEGLGSFSPSFIFSLARIYSIYFRFRFLLLTFSADVKLNF